MGRWSGSGSHGLHLLLCQQVGASGHRAQATSRGADGRQQSVLRKPMCVDAGQVLEGWRRCACSRPQPSVLGCTAQQAVSWHLPLPSSRCGPTRVSLEWVQLSGHWGLVPTGLGSELATLGREPAGRVPLPGSRCVGQPPTAPEAAMPATQATAWMSTPPHVPLR